MAVNNIKKVDGKIIISEKNFNRIIEKEVIKNNDTSGKILLPKSLINKKIFVCWYEEVEK
ncbi:MAG: hypothetical protein KKE05_04495 [Nanoarchaeota archaeon]|nr:hypothetical protein [Nanoarchaeota archaeon]